MELTPSQRKAVFGLIVLVLAGLGLYLFVPGAAGSKVSGPGAQHSTQPRAAPAAAPSARPSPVPSPRPSAAPSAPDIYQWLPFTQADLAAAATLASDFAAAYGTWSYRRNAAAYVAAMGGLVTPELSQYLAQAYSVPGVAGLRASMKQVSQASAVINSLRAFGASSITFVVTISQDMTATAGSSHTATQYAVTVISAGGEWRVNDIELASAGNS